MNFCTTADINYLTKALALYQSLCDNVEDFTLYFLCIDFETWQKIGELNLKNVSRFKLERLEEIDIELQQAKNNPPSKYGTQYSQYCWTLTPYFTNYILNNFIKKNEYLMYVDADIYFYGNPQRILDEMNGASVGIHTHRFTEPFRETDSGWYNCGIVVFKNDISGNGISEAWKKWLLNPKNKHYETHGKCGDQKYLELFLYYSSFVSVFDKNILHGAPWCCNDLKDKEILWYHFSHFTVKDGKWSDHINLIPEWNPTAHSFIKPYYENYFKVIQEKEKMINA